MDKHDVALQSNARVAGATASTVVDLWTVRTRGRTWTGQIKSLGTYGTEFRLLRDGALSSTRRFETHAAAVKEANEQRALLEWGWVAAE